MPSRYRSRQPPPWGYSAMRKLWSPAWVKEYSGFHAMLLRVESSACWSTGYATGLSVWSAKRWTVQFGRGQAPELLEAVGGGVNPIDGLAEGQGPVPAIERGVKRVRAPRRQQGEVKLVLSHFHRAEWHLVAQPEILRQVDGKRHAQFARRCAIPVAKVHVHFHAVESRIKAERLLQAEMLKLRLVHGGARKPALAPKFAARKS